MKALKIILTVCMVLPLFAVPRLTGEMTLRGYESWEAIFLALGMTLPLVLVLLVVLFLLERRTRKMPH